MPDRTRIQRLAPFVSLAVLHCRGPAAPTPRAAPVDAARPVAPVADVVAATSDATGDIAQAPDDAGPPPVHWAPTTILRERPLPDAGGLTTDGGAADAGPPDWAQPSDAVLVPLADGAVALWTLADSGRGQTAVFARRIDTGGHFAGPVRRVKRLVGQIDEFDADAAGSNVWVGYSASHGREYVRAAFEVRADLTAVSDVVSLARFRPRAAPPEQLALAAGEDGYAYLLFADRYDQMSEAEMARASAEATGGAPSGNPTVGWSAVTVRPDHTFYATSVFDDEVAPVGDPDDDDEWSPSLVRVRGGARWALTREGIPALSGWLGGAGSGPAMAADPGASVALEWSGQALFELSFSAENRGTAQALLRADDAPTWSYGEAMVFDGIALRCRDGHPRLVFTAVAPDAGGDLEIDPGTPGASRWLDLLPDQHVARGAVWAGRSLVTIVDDRAAPLRCNAAGDLEPGE